MHHCETTRRNLTAGSPDQYKVCMCVGRFRKVARRASPARVAELAFDAGTARGMPSDEAGGRDSEQFHGPILARAATAIRMILSSRRANR